MVFSIFFKLHERYQIVQNITDDMMSAFSIHSVVWMNIELLHWFLRNLEKCLWQYFMPCVLVSLNISQSLVALMSLLFLGVVV